MAEKTVAFEALRERRVLDILNGDVSFGGYEFKDGKTVEVALPYLRGRDLCELSCEFGDQLDYDGNEAGLSRWQYLDNLVVYCIKNNSCSELLKHLFARQRFQEILSGHSPKEIEDAYKIIINKVLEGINGCLYFNGNELVIVGSNYIVRPIETKIELRAPTTKLVDREYIKDILERAEQEIEQGNYDSAITKARTLLEEVFCYVVESKYESPKTKGGIQALYNQVKDLYKMHGDTEMDKRINALLSGLEKIVSSVAEMRNKNSDAHGVGANRINIEEHHARLFLNAAITMAEFILSVQQNSEQKGQCT